MSKLRVKKGLGKAQESISSITKTKYKTQKEAWHRTSSQGLSFYEKEYLVLDSPLAFAGAQDELFALFEFCLFPRIK